jgi:hypothetical protein
MAETQSTEPNKDPCDETELDLETIDFANIDGVLFDTIYCYIKDLSEIFCEHGIDLAVMINNANKQMMGSGIYTSILIPAIFKDINLIIEEFELKRSLPFAMPTHEQVAKLLSMVLNKLKKEGFPYCNLVEIDQGPLVKVQPSMARTKKITTEKFIKSLAENEKIKAKVQGHTNKMKLLIQSTTDQFKEALDEIIGGGRRRHRRSKRRPYTKKRRTKRRRSNK